MEHDNKNLIVKYALLTEENLLLTAQIEQSFAEIMNKLVSDFFEKLKLALAETLGDKWRITAENYFGNNIFDRNWSFVVWKKDWEDTQYGCYYTFGFETDKARLSNFYFYAFRNENIIKNPLDNVYHALNEHYKKGRRVHSYDWYQYADYEYRTWLRDEMLVKLYRNDDIVEYFEEQLIKMKEIIEPIVDKEMKTSLKNKRILKKGDL